MSIANRINRFIKKQKKKMRVSYFKRLGHVNVQANTHDRRKRRACDYTLRR